MTRDLDNLAKNRQELLAGRDALINDLKSQLKLLTKGIGEMSSFFKQAQAFAGARAPRLELSFPRRACEWKTGKAGQPAQCGASRCQPSGKRNSRSSAKRCKSDRRGRGREAACGSVKRYASRAGTCRRAIGCRVIEQVRRASGETGGAAIEPCDKKQPGSAAPGSTGAAIKAAAPGPAPHTIPAGLLERVSVELLKSAAL